MKNENTDAFGQMEDRIRRKKEAARRIIELSGELHLSISELDRVMEYVKCSAGLVLLD